VEANLGHGDRQEILPRQGLALIERISALLFMTKVPAACFASFLAFAAVVLAESSDDALSVANGDFSDFTVLQEMAGGCPHPAR
jgi:hypothetical protein